MTRILNSQRFSFALSLSPVYNTSSPPQVLMSFPLGEGVWEPVTWPAFTFLVPDLAHCSAYTHKNQDTTAVKTGQ